MAIETSESFRKSRSRVIYFSSIGSLLCFFPVDAEKSSLFGLSFKNLGAESIAYLFFAIAIILFLEFLFHVFEEMPVLWGQHASVFKRFEKSDFQKIEIEDSLRKISENFNDILSKQTEIPEKRYEQLVSTKEQIERTVERAAKDFFPGKFTTKAGKVRLWVEYFSGLIIFFIYIGIFSVQILCA